MIDLYDVTLRCRQCERDLPLAPAVGKASFGGPPRLNGDPAPYHVTVPSARRAMWFVTGIADRKERVLVHRAADDGTVISSDGRRRRQYVSGGARGPAYEFRCPRGHQTRLKRSTLERRLDEARSMRLRTVAV